MDTTFILAALFMIASFALAAVLGNLALNFLWDLFDPPIVSDEEAPEEDAVQYTAAFETYWIWRGAHATGIPNIFLSDRVKPVAFAAWQSGRKQLLTEGY